MKKIITFILALLLILSFASCSNEKNNSSNEDSISQIDVDLTQLSSTMVYSEVYNMVTTPKNYVGKNVKMTGTFKVYYNSELDCYYYCCIIADATACCSQGLEFILKGKTKLEQYPEQDTEITVKGTFQTYMEGTEMYCHLVDAELC